MKREQMGLIVKREDGSEIVNYDDENFPSYIYDGWVKPHVTWEKVPHFHEDLEFISVRSGNMAYSVNGKTVMLHEGDTIFVNANQIHYSMAVEEEPAKYVIFVVHPSVLTSSVAVEMQVVLPILTNPNLPYLRFRGINENTEKMHKLMLTLPDIRRDPFHITRQLFAIWEIILNQSSTYGELETTQSMDTHMRAFKNMMYFIQSEYKNSITLEQIAAKGNVGKSMCNKLFHQYAGLSPIGYLLDFRVRKVAELLSTTSCNLGEIAAMTGFNGVSYMSEMFKKSFGLSPLQYRASQKERIG